MNELGAMKQAHQQLKDEVADLRLHLQQVCDVGSPAGVVAQHATC